MNERYEIAICGCTTTPLASYLKALGILRLVTEQVDARARGDWQRHAFVLHSTLSKEGLREFFLGTYRPTPIISPWNGRAGFLEGDNADGSRRKGAVIVHRVMESAGERFSSYRAVLSAVQKVSVIQALNSTRVEVKRLDKEKKKLKERGQSLPPDKERRLTDSKTEERRLKNQLLLSLRAELSDEFLPWIDACVVLASGEKFTTPLLGSGGNEGSMDFSVNHLTHLSKLVDPATDEPTPNAKLAIDNALFGTTASIQSDGNPGFLNPGVVGGTNMGSGYSGSKGDNPWNTVLMLEGAVLFAAAVTKRSNSSTDSSLSFPFMFDPLRAGFGTVGPKEKARPEFWAPIWATPVSLSELRSLLTEGRNTIGRRPAKDGLDMARAASSLGVERGIQSFERFGLFERRGKGYYVASPLGTFTVSANPSCTLIDELEKGAWLSRFRHFCHGDKAASRFVSLRKRLEDSLFDLARRRPSPQRTQAVLMLLGEIQLALAVSAKAKESLGPVPRLSPRWTLAADDGTPAYRIARALAGLRGMEGRPLPLLAQMFAVHPFTNDWIETACSAKGARNDPACRIRLHVPFRGDLVRTLIALLERRLWIAKFLDFPDKPFLGSAGIGLDDLDAFLRDSRMDNEINALLPGLSLCEIPRTQEQRAGEGPALAAYGLLKLVLTPDAWLDKLADLPRDQRIPVPARLIPMLASGNQEQTQRAVEVAWRRLRGAGLIPSMPFDQVPELLELDPRRVAASMLVPITYGATGALVRTALTQSELSDDAA